MFTPTARGSTLVVRIWRPQTSDKNGPRTERIKIFIMVIDPQYLGIVIEMKQTKLTKTCMMISNWSPWFIQKYFRVVRLTFSLPYMTEISVAIRQ